MVRTTFRTRDGGTTQVSVQKKHEAGAGKLLCILTTCRSCSRPGGRWLRREKAACFQTRLRPTTGGSGGFFAGASPRADRRGRVFCGVGQLQAMLLLRKTKKR